MKEIISKIENALTGGNVKEARELIAKYLKLDLSEQEKASLYLIISTTYMEAMNKVNNYHKKVLEEILGEFRTKTLSQV